LIFPEPEGCLSKWASFQGVRTEIGNFDSRFLNAAPSFSSATIIGTTFDQCTQLARWGKQGHIEMFETKSDVFLRQSGFEETELDRLMTAAASKCIGCKLLKLRKLFVRKVTFGCLAQIGVNWRQTGLIV
jgi:hypothetical protein